MLLTIVFKVKLRRSARKYLALQLENTYFTENIFRTKLSSEKCHLIRASHKIDYKYGNFVNFGNFTRAVKAHCKNIYNSNIKQDAVEKCVNDAGPPFIKKQKATVADVKKDGEKLVNQAKACSKNMKDMYQKAEKQIYQKCHNVR